MRRRSFLALVSTLPLSGAFASAPARAAQPNSAAPLQIVVSLGSQTLKVFEGRTEIAASPISSGKSGHATPTGIFSILDKKTFHRSNIYSNAPMPFMQRLTWSGIALHASNHVPAYPASHGCVRMPEAFARRLYDMTAMHGHVVIADAPSVLRPIVHPALFQPPPAEDQLFLSDNLELRLDSLTIGDEPVEVASARIGAGPLAEIQPERDMAPLRLLITRRTDNALTRDVQHLLNVLGFDAGAVDGFIGRQTIGALKAFQREATLPVTGMVTKAEIDRLHEATGRGPAPTGHLYARRAFQPIFDAPVVIAAPERPLGTHLLTVESIRGGRAEWLALSLADRPRPSVRDRFDIEEDMASAAIIRLVLGRLKVEEATRKRIGKLLTAGASLAISDNGLGPETGKGTDFVVLTRG